MPKTSAAPPRARRKPVLTSSKISTAPNSWVMARTPARKPSWGRMPWALPSTGSMMTAAMLVALALEDAAQRGQVVVADRDHRLG